jgi:transcriptional regulator with XRE-family HTH domain
MLQDGKPATANEPDGFPARLRQVLASYGSTSALARSIQRSEGAVRKWLRGQSEPAVSDLRAICEATHTNVEWLVMGRGEQRGMVVRDPQGSPGSGEDEPLAKLDYKLMEDVVLTIRLEPRVMAAAISPQKCSDLITTVYNISRAKRRVDPEEAERIAALAT